MDQQPKAASDGRSLFQKVTETAAILIMDFRKMRISTKFDKK